MDRPFRNVFVNQKIRRNVVAISYLITVNKDFALFLRP
jgi:hypothetical protein